MKIAILDECFLTTSHINQLKKLGELKIYGAALDVVDDFENFHPILKLENVVFTPHIGSCTEESFYQNMPDMIVKNVDLFIKGESINIVN